MVSKFLGLGENLFRGHYVGKDNHVFLPMFPPWLSDQWAMIAGMIRKSL